MMRIVTVILTVLLLAPGLSTAADRQAQPEAPGKGTAGATAKKLDLNRVSREELVGVPGIGPRMAQTIIDLRTKKGSFTRVEELLEVTGIKEKKFAALTKYLEVVPPQAASASAPATSSR